MEELGEAAVLLLVAVGSFLFAFAGVKALRMLVQRKRTGPLDPDSIPRFQPGQLQTTQRESFLQWMDQEGFAIISMDESMQKQVAEYWSVSREFFQRPMDYKKNFRGVPKYKDEIFNDKRQVNKGFLTLEEKEFLKLSLTDPTQTMPDLPGFEERFTTLCTSMEALMRVCYTTIANSTDKTTSKPVHEPKVVEAVSQFLREGSSISMIDYQPMTRDAAEAKPGRDLPTEASHYPSATHEDTGFLTMIVCSDVPALQIMDRVTGEWIMPEKFCRPKQDAFVIIGKKVPRLAEIAPGAAQRFTSTVHRVSLPYGTHRNSLLYFQDIPS